MNFPIESRSRHQEYQAYMHISLSWLPLISATAYLDLVNVFSSHYFCSHSCSKSLKACCIDQRTRLSISWCLKSFFARCRMQFDDERQGDSLDRFRWMEFPSSSVSSNSTSYRLLNYWGKIPCLTKTKASSNRSQQRTGKQSSTNLTPFESGGKSVNQRLLDRYVMYGSRFGLPAEKPLTLTVLWAQSESKRIYWSWSHYTSISNHGWLHEIAQRHHPADSWVCFFYERVLPRCIEMKVKFWGNCPSLTCVY